MDRGPTVGPTDGHGPGLFDLCTVAVRSRSGYLGLTAVHGPLKSSGPRQHCDSYKADPDKKAFVPTVTRSRKEGLCTRQLKYRY